MCVVVKVYTGDSLFVVEVISEEKGAKIVLCVYVNQKIEGPDFCRALLAIYLVVSFNRRSSHL